MSTNIDLFNQYTAKIFAMLYEPFPVTLWIRDGFISGRVVRPGVFDESVTDEQVEIAGYTLKWLIEAGYITCSRFDANSAHDATLSAKGLELMKLVPSSLEKKKSVGDSLLTIVKDGSSDGGKKLISKALTDFFPIICQTMMS